MRLKVKNLYKLEDVTLGSYKTKFTKNYNIHPKIIKKGLKPFFIVFLLRFKIRNVIIPSKVVLDMSIFLCNFESD